MSWVDPSNRNTGDLITAAIWNQDVVANAQALYDGQWKVAVLRDEKTSGTDGGTFTSGAWRTRDLNAEDDADGIVSLSSNQFTPQAGTYLLLAFAPAYKTDKHQARLYNATQSSAEIAGSLGRSDATGGSVSFSVCAGVFTANGTDAYELQHQCATSKSSDGLGVAGSFTTEVYAVVVLIWLSS